MIIFIIDHSPHGRELVVQSLRYVKNKMITTTNLTISHYRGGNFLCLFFFNKQVGVYTPKGVVPPARHLSHIVHTNIMIIIDTTKHYINYFIRIFTVMKKNYVDDMSPKQKMGFKVLVSIVRKKYPFIKDITIPIPLDQYGSFLILNIVFDLEDLWKFYDVKPPAYYSENRYLHKLLEQSHSYLMTYIDDQYDGNFGYEYNNQLEHYMYTAYRSLPKDMTYLQYEKWDGDDNDIETSIKKDQHTVEFRIREFVPIFDSSKYYKEKDL